MELRVAKGKFYKQHLLLQISIYNNNLRVLFKLETKKTGLLHF